MSRDPLRAPGPDGHRVQARLTRPVCKDDLRSCVNTTDRILALALLEVRSSRRTARRTNCAWLPCVRPAAKDDVSGDFSKLSFATVFAFGGYLVYQDVDALFSRWLETPAGVVLRAAARCALSRTSCYIELKLPGALCPIEDGGGGGEAECGYQIKSCLYDDGRHVHAPALVVMQIAPLARPATAPQALRPPTDPGFWHLSSTARSTRLLDAGSLGHVPTVAANLAVDGAACCVTLLQYPSGLILFQNPRSKAYMGDLVGKALGQLFLRQLLSEATFPAASGGPLDAMMQALEAGKEFETIVQVPVALGDLERSERRVNKDSGAPGTVRNLNLQRCTSVFTDLLTTDEDGQEILDSEDRLLLEALTRRPSPRRDDQEGGDGAGGAATGRRRVRRSISLHEVDRPVLRPPTNILTEALQKPVHSLSRARRAESQRHSLRAPSGRAASFSLITSGGGARSSVLGGSRTINLLSNTSGQPGPDVGSVSGRSRLALANSSSLYCSAELTNAQRIRGETAGQAAAAAATSATAAAAAAAKAAVTVSGHTGGPESFGVQRRSTYMEHGCSAGGRDVGLLGPVLQRQHQQHQQQQAQHNQHAQQNQHAQHPLQQRQPSGISGEHSFPTRTPCTRFPLTMSTGGGPGRVPAAGGSTSLATASTANSDPSGPSPPQTSAAALAVAVGSSGTGRCLSPPPDEVWSLVRDLGLRLPGRGYATVPPASITEESSGPVAAAAVAPPPQPAPVVSAARTAPTQGETRGSHLPAALLTRKAAGKGPQRTSTGQLGSPPGGGLMAARFTSPPAMHLLGRRGASVLGRAHGSAAGTSPTDLLSAEQDIRTSVSSGADTSVRLGTAPLAGQAGLGHSSSHSSHLMRPMDLDSLTLATLSVVRQTNMSMMGREDSAQQQLMPQQPQSQQPGCSSQERQPSPSNSQLGADVVPVLEFMPFPDDRQSTIQRTDSTLTPLEAGDLVIDLREGSNQTLGWPTRYSNATGADAGVDAVAAEALLAPAGPLPPRGPSNVTLSPGGGGGSSSTFISARGSGSGGSGSGGTGGDEATAVDEEAEAAPGQTAADPKFAFSKTAPPALGGAMVAFTAAAAAAEGLVSGHTRARAQAMESATASGTDTHLLLVGAFHDDVHTTEGGAGGVPGFSTSMSMRTGECTGPHSGFTTATGPVTTSTLAIQPAWPDVPSSACSPFRSSCTHMSTGATVKAAAMVASDILGGAPAGACEAAAATRPSTGASPQLACGTRVLAAPKRAASPPQQRQLRSIVAVAQPNAAAGSTSPSEACLTAVFASLPTSPMAGRSMLVRTRSGSGAGTAASAGGGAGGADSVGRGLRLLGLDRLHAASTLMRGHQDQLLSASPAAVSPRADQLTSVDVLTTSSAIVATAATSRPSPLSTPAAATVASVAAAGRRVPSMPLQVSQGLVATATAGAIAAAARPEAAAAVAMAIRATVAAADVTLTGQRDINTGEGTFAVASLPSISAAHLMDNRRRATVDGLQGGDPATGTFSASYEAALQREASLGAPSASTNVRSAQQRSRRSVPLRSQNTARRLTQLLHSFSSQAPFVSSTSGAAMAAAAAAAEPGSARARHGPAPQVLDIGLSSDAGGGSGGTAAAAAVAPATPGSRGSKAIGRMSSAVMSAAAMRASSATAGAANTTRRVWHKIIVHCAASPAAAPAAMTTATTTMMTAPAPTAAAPLSPLSREISIAGTSAAAARAPSPGAVMTGLGSRAGVHGSRLAGGAMGAGGGRALTLTVTQIDVTEQVEAQAGLTKLLEQEHKVLEGIFPRHVIEYMTLQEGVKASPAVAGAAGSSLLTLAPGSMERMASLATWHVGVTILFADCVGFTSMCHAATPLTVMAFLNQLYSRFDDMIDIYKVYKVETIGDCYMVAGGLVAYDDDGYKSVISGAEDPLHAVRVMEFAKAMLRASRDIRMPHTGEPVQMRIGLHSGPVTSGVVGERMPRFCVFGDTVNVASRMETTCRPGCIHVSAATQARLPSEPWRDRGMTLVKGKGEMRTFEWAGDVDAPVDGDQLQRVIGLYL